MGMLGDPPLSGAAEGATLCPMLLGRTLAALSLCWLATGCIVESSGQPGPCGGRACSKHGHCERGTDECRCDSGFVGNPYASYGCQPSAPGAACDTTCGLNAYCSDGACLCAEGFAAVCGTGDCLAESALCDGNADCANAADEQADVCFETVVMEWQVTDTCDDGTPIFWRIWATDRGWVWPSADTEFMTYGLGQPATEAIECLEGETVCFGGSAGDIDWGLGMSGVVPCDDCCEVCRAVSLDYGALACG